MSKVEQAWAALMELPSADQELAANAILGFAETRRGLQLTDEQVAEVRRRVAEPNATTLSIDEARARLKKLGA